MGNLRADRRDFKLLPLSPRDLENGSALTLVSRRFVQSTALAIVLIASCIGLTVQFHWWHAVAQSGSPQAVQGKWAHWKRKHIKNNLDRPPCLFWKGKLHWGCGKKAPQTPKKRSKPTFGLAGVNLGGWLHLEDWFFSGSEGTKVMSTDPNGQGLCLPPRISSLDKPWPSEGILVSRLNKTIGPNKTLEAFAAHRETFIQDKDFFQIAAVGLGVLRVPITWAAFADALRPINPEIYGSHDPDQDEIIVPDPHYANEAALVTIPRDFLLRLLYMAKHYGLRVHFDMHSLPGGSGHGTYNGVYPLKPAFWTANASLAKEQNITLRDTGLLIAKAMVNWVESLTPEVRGSIAGLTFMNEPAHMNAIGKENFLTDDDSVLDWLASAAHIFRQSTLPEEGIRLYVSVIETSIHDFGCAFIKHAKCGFDRKVPTWWQKTFTKKERMKWAVIDLHRYDAYSAGQCDGRVGVGGAYKCSDPLKVKRKVWNDPDQVRSCTAGWARSFQEKFPYSLRAATELSGSTYWNPKVACNDLKTVAAYIDTQSRLMKENFIDEQFFWTWRMPHGANFEPAWSLKGILGFEKGRKSPCIRPHNQTVNKSNTDNNEASDGPPVEQIF